MSKRTLLAVGGLVAWTLFVWIGRLRNIFADDALAGTELAWRLALAGSFTVLGLLAAAAWMPAAVARRPLGGPQRGLVTALAAFTIVVWIVRWVGIVAADHAVGFVVVHTVLAVVSTILAGAALRSIRSDASDLSSSRAVPVAPRA